MKNRGLTEEQRKAERHLRAKRILYMAKIRKCGDDPRAIAEILYHEFCESRLHGTWRIHNEIERHKDPRFIGRMLMALGEYLLEGQPRFDNRDFDVADMMNLPVHLPDPELVSELKKRHPKCTPQSLKMRVRRLREAWLKGIPMSDLKPPL